jgi:hypothetical protein
MIVEIYAEKDWMLEVEQDDIQNKQFQGGGAFDRCVQG